jgi:purine-binding chemotaxis protein CheW
VRHVIFRVGAERYALPLSAVREVVPPAPLSLVPRAPAPIAGIMNLRGRVVTVVVLAGLLGLPTDPAEAGTGRIVLLDRGRRDLGLRVSDVPGIQALEEITPAPGETLASVCGVARAGDDAVTVLDADGLERQILALFRR